jgi:hypothetical protein
MNVGRAHSPGAAAIMPDGTQEEVLTLINVNRPPCAKIVCRGAAR